MGRLQELYQWGHKTTKEYLAEQNALEQELKEIEPPQTQKGEVLDKLAAFLKDVSTAWKNADEDLNLNLSLTFATRGCLSMYCSGDPDRGQGIKTDFYVEVSTSLTDKGSDVFNRRYLHQTRSKLTPSQKEEVVQTVLAGRSLRTVAREYGVSHETIRHIAKTWVTG